MEDILENEFGFDKSESFDIVLKLVAKNSKFYPGDPG